MILTKLADHSNERVEQAKKEISFKEVKAAAEEKNDGDFLFEKALKSVNLAFISEVKKASPSKGVIADDFPYIDIAKAYEQAGTDAISVLTEPKYFLGSNEIFKEIRKAVKTPLLRKDFTVDPYQIYEAKMLGADAVLLICSLMEDNPKVLQEYLEICDQLGISALVETHDQEEIDFALDNGARIIGVNNRNLKDFTVDFNNVGRLIHKVPDDILFIAESGVKDADDIKKLAHLGADAVLVGEALMKSENKQQMLTDFRKAGEMSYEN